MADETPYNTSELLDSLIIPNSTSFHGQNSEDESFDAFWLQSGKKRRLSADQVQFLEKNFELQNKLEPDRRIQLAKELGLQPRQVAIWFQNRRARFKTKQLEKDYASLKSSYENLKSQYENLVAENEKLKTEAEDLKDKIMAHDSSRGFEAEQSDCFSRDEHQENLRFPKLESCYYDDGEPIEGCCDLIGFQVDDQALGFWPY